MEMERDRKTSTCFEDNKNRQKKFEKSAKNVFKRVKRNRKIIEKLKKTQKNF